MGSGYNSVDIYHPDTPNWDVKSASRAEQARMIRNQQEQRELVERGLLELPDETLHQVVYVQTREPTFPRILNCEFEQGIDDRWYYAFTGTAEHRNQFTAIMLSYGVRDVEALRREEQAKAITTAKEDALKTHGGKLGELLAQGVEEGIIGVSEYYRLTPALHRRIVRAVRLTVRSALAYMSGLFNRPGDQST